MCGADHDHLGTGWEREAVWYTEVEEQTMRLEVILDKDETGYYVASCPAIKGCHTQGRTKREALANIREAILGCLETLNEQAKRQGRRHHAQLVGLAV